MNAYLRSEVARFKAWAASQPHVGTYGEWECEYPDWPALCSAFEQFLVDSDHQAWQREDIEDVLYAVGRDNEIQHLATIVARSTSRLFFLADIAIGHSETDAAWQLVVELGNAGDRVSEAEALLLRAASHNNEYVRRQSLLALAKLRSAKTEELALRSWSSDYEYQRIAALWALHETQSPKLAGILTAADNDENEYVRSNAQQIREVVNQRKS